MLVTSDGERIEQRLRRMLVGAIASIDDVSGRALGKVVRSTRRAVSNDEDVRMHGLEVFHGV